MEILLLRDGKQHGPYTQDQIQEGLEDGWITASDLIWYEGLEEWKRVDDVFEVERIPEGEASPAGAPPKAESPAAPFASEPSSDLPARTKVMKKAPSKKTASASPSSTGPESSSKPKGGPKPTGTGSIKWVPIGLGLGGVVLVWLGLTFWTSLQVERMVSEALDKVSSRPAMASLFLESESFDRGLFSSRSVVKTEPVDTKSGDGKPIRILTRIHHGPIVMGAGMPRFLSTYAVSTVDWKEFGEETQGVVERAFAGKEPVELRSSVGFSGAKTFEVVLNSGSLSEDDVSLSFDGGSGKIRTGAKLEQATGRLEAGALRLETSEGGDKLELQLNPSQVQLDYEQGRRLQAEGTFGQLRISGTGTGTEEGTLRTEEGTLRANYTRLSPDAEILVGMTEFVLPSIKVAGGESSVEVEDLRVRLETREESGKLTSFVRYSVAGLDLGEDVPALPDTPIEVSQILRGRASVELGSRGFDSRNYASLQKHTRTLQALQLKRMRDEVKSGDDEGEPMSEAEMEAIREVLDKLLDLIEPGAEFYLDAEVGGGAVTADVNLGFGGEKKLRELATLGELLAAVTGEAKIFLRHGVLPEEQAEAMLGAQLEMGMVTRGENGYEFLGGLKEGQLLLGGKPTPFLMMLGPLLDQPIPWDQLFQGLPGKKPDA